LFDVKRIGQNTASVTAASYSKGNVHQLAIVGSLSTSPQRYHPYSLAPVVFYLKDLLTMLSLLVVVALAFPVRHATECSIELPTTCFSCFLWQLSVVARRFAAHDVLGAQHTLLFVMISAPIGVYKHVDHRSSQTQQWAAVQRWHLKQQHSVPCSCNWAGCHNALPGLTWEVGNSAWWVAAEKHSMAQTASLAI